MPAAMLIVSSPCVNKLLVIWKSQNVLCRAFKETLCLARVEVGCLGFELPFLALRHDHMHF
jgi:hypothetical protein